MFLSKLFSKTSIGQIAEWQIEVDGDFFRTHEGIVGGKITTSAWTKCNGKNPGKKNETTPEAQALKEATSKYKKKKENNCFENIEDIDNTLFFEPMLAEKYSDYSCLITFPIHSQPKLDGMRCVVSKDGMFSRNGKPILSTPHIYKCLSFIFDKYPNLKIDGEIYNHDLKHNFNKIISLAKKTKPKPEDLIASETFLEYWIYDISFGDEKLFSERAVFIQKNFDGIPKIKITPTFVSINQKELDSIYESFLSEGFEGQMIRKDSKYENKRTKSLIKRKEFIDSEFEIVDIKEGKGNRAGLASTVILKNGNETFDAGVIGNNDYCKSLLANKEKAVGKQATIRYQNLTPDGSPRFGKMKIIRNYE